MFEFPVTLTKDDNGTVIAMFVDVPEAIPMLKVKKMRLLL